MEQNIKNDIKNNGCRNAPAADAISKKITPEPYLVCTEK
jgi:hypothetical protein